MTPAPELVLGVFALEARLVALRRELRAVDAERSSLLAVVRADEELARACTIVRLERKLAVLDGEDRSRLRPECRAIRERLRDATARRLEALLGAGAS